MRFRHNDWTKWHRLFLWFPELINAEWVWLEVVERRRIIRPFRVGRWEWRTLTDTKSSVAPLVIPPPRPQE